MFGTISPSERTVYDDVLNGREINVLKNKFFCMYISIFFSSSDYGFFYGGDD